MIKQLVFHTGDPKTGTSSIQGALHQKAWVCSSTRIVFQDELNAAPLANSLVRESDPQLQIAEFGAKADWAGRHDADIGVISSEFFARRDPRRLQAALEEYLPDQAPSARIISYVRPHASRVLSSYGQRIKTGTFAGTLEEFVTFIATVPTLYYHKRFAAWRRVFGDRFVLRPFIRSELHDGDAVSDFFETVLQGKDFELLPVVETNEALSPRDLAGALVVQNVLNARWVSSFLRQSIGGAIQRKLAEIPDRSGGKLILDRTNARALLDIYAQDARTLDAEFFDGTPMEQALRHSLEVAVEAPQSLRPAEHFDKAELAQLRSLAGQIARRVNNMPQAWRREYQDYTGQRAARAEDKKTPKMIKNARGVWAGIDEITQILSSRPSI